MLRYVSEERRDSMVEDVERFVLKRRLSDGHLLHDMNSLHVALVLCTGGYVYDHQIYSRHFHPARFDSHASALTLIHERTLEKPLLAYKKRIPKDMADIEDELVDISLESVEQHLFSGVDEYGNSVYVILVEDPIHGIVREVHIPMYTFTYVLLLPTMKAEIELDAHLASCIFYEMNRSRKFRKRFLRHIVSRHCFHRWKDSTDALAGNKTISAELDLPCLVEVQLKWPKQKMDYAWDYRIQGQVKKRAQLEENLAWLNTLGGGYASLGDYFRHHAVKAGEISIHQLAISIELGDAISAAKCRLFFAQSLLQCGYLKQSKRIVREQYEFAVKEIVRDDKLEAMCKALWNRLKYLYSLRRNNKRVRIQDVSRQLISLSS